MALADMLASITREPGCDILPPNPHTESRSPTGAGDLAELRELRAACSEVRLHTGHTHHWAVYATPAAAGPILLGEPTATLVHADSPDDLSNTCFVIATDENAFATGFHVVIDLHQARTRRCYLATWDSFGPAGEMPVVATGVAGLLQWLLELAGSSPLEKLPELGDAYDHVETTAASPGTDRLITRLTCGFPDGTIGIHAAHQGRPVIHSTIECRNCGQGLFEFAVRIDTGELYLECDECLTGFTEVVDGRLGRGFLTVTTDWAARTATVDEIAAAGLAWSIREDLT